MTNDKQKQGKRNRAAGQRFERKVREDLEKKGWIVSKWQNNIKDGKIVPAKMGRFHSNQGGFPDFFIYQKEDVYFEVIFVECKINGYLKPEERAKAETYLERGLCSKFFIAMKGEKRGEIIYKNFRKTTNTFK